MVLPFYCGIQDEYGTETAVLEVVKCYNTLHILLTSVHVTIFWFPG